MSILNHVLSNLTNDQEYFVRLYPQNPKGHLQSELEGQVVSAVPVAIRYLEYIEASGGQYINTKISPDINTGAEVVFMCTNRDGTPQSPFATITGANAGYWGCATQGMQMFNYWGVGTTLSGIYFAANMKYVYRINYLNDKLCNVNGTQQATLSNSATITTNSIYLFCMNKGTYSDNQYFKGRIYSAIITKGNSIIAEFYPALNDDGVPCLYEKISKTFYTNAGSGSFIAGPEV